MCGRLHSHVACADCGCGLGVQARVCPPKDVGLAELLYQKTAMPARWCIRYPELLEDSPLACVSPKLWGWVHVPCLGRLIRELMDSLDVASVRMHWRKGHSFGGEVPCRLSSWTSRV